jgi:hypothetical protein
MKMTYKSVLLMGAVFAGVLSAEGITPTHVGTHQIGESLETWLRQEPTSQAPSSEIAPHRIGETTDEWLTFNQLDLGTICQSHRDKAVCKKLSAIRDSGSGDFYTQSTSGTFGWRFAGGRVVAYSVQEVPGMSTNEWHNTQPPVKEEIVTKTNNRQYTWKFANGRLSTVSIVPASFIEFANEVNLLTQTYGKPSKIEAIPYQNGYGAHWERSRVTWFAPDGIIIIANERTEFNVQNGLSAVGFYSKESFKAPKAEPNPY